MIGGYLSFMGIEGKGCYNHTPVEEILPVDFLDHDDREEHPEGLEVSLDPSSHEIFSGLPKKLSGILGYNRAILKDGCRAIARIENDPFIAIGEFGEGRSMAFATDCAPHWCSEELCESPAYAILWQNIVKWLAGKRN